MDTMELIALAKTGDKQAQAQVVEENLGLVWSVVKKFSGRSYEADDLFQIGSIGIIKAIQNFDLSFGVRFSTYAVPMIMGEIKRFLRDDGVIKVSRSLKELASKARITKEMMEKELCREPTVGELAARLGVEAGDLIMAMDASAQPESLYKTIHEGDRSDIYLMDQLASADHEGGMVDKIALSELVEQLDDRDKRIIYLRYYKGKTQMEIARLLGISQVQVSRLEKKILFRLREQLKEA